MRIERFRLGVTCELSIRLRPGMEILSRATKGTCPEKRAN